MTGFSRTDSRHRSHRFTFIELLIMIAIVFILAALLYPAVIRSKARSRNVKCINRCKHISVAVTVYASEFDGCFPLDGPEDADVSDDAPWFQKIRELLGDDSGTSVALPFVRDPGMPADPTNTVDAKDESNYMFNKNANHIAGPNPPKWVAAKIEDVVDPCNTNIIICGSLPSFRTGDETDIIAENVIFPHPAIGQQSNVLFVDAHVQSINRTDVPKLSSDTFWKLD